MVAQASAFYGTYFGKLVCYIASQVGEIFCLKATLAHQDEFPYNDLM